MHGMSVLAKPDPLQLDTRDKSAAIQKTLFHAAVFITSFLVLFSRRPDVILNPQFYAEDGARWYADAYQMGWHCLLVPDSGYLQTVSRFIGFLAMLFPFVLAPLVMNLFALTAQILPVNFFLSSRFAGISFYTRLAGSLLYLAIPNSIEVHANTTNIQWHLALLAFLVLVAEPARSRTGLALDLLVLALLSLDSPLTFVLTPIAAAFLFLALSSSRVPVQNGANLIRLAGILGGQIFLSAELGVRSVARLYFFGDRHTLLYLECVAMILGFAVCLYCFRHASIELRLFLLFAAGILMMALSRPIAGPDLSFPQWEYLQLPGRSSRYYFFPILAFYAALIWIASAGGSRLRSVPRYLALALLLLVPVGAYRDWRYPAFTDFHFQTYAAAFERAPSGSRIIIPLNPQGWEMRLVKH